VFIVYSLANHRVVQSVRMSDVGEEGEAGGKSVTLGKGKAVEFEANEQFIVIVCGLSLSP
jgi:hypothetical protein